MSGGSGTMQMRELCIHMFARIARFRICELKFVFTLLVSALSQLQNVVKGYSLMSYN